MDYNWPVITRHSSRRMSGFLMKLRCIFATLRFPASRGRRRSSFAWKMLIDDSPASNPERTLRPARVCRRDRRVFANFPLFTRGSEIYCRYWKSRLDEARVDRSDARRVLSRCRDSPERFVLCAECEI